MKIVLIIISVLVIGMIAFLGLRTSDPDLQLRYKITINVQTPEGTKSGSAIREIVIDKFKGFNPDKADFNSNIYGEAVVVDLGEKQLFSILERNSYNEVFGAFPTQYAPLSQEGIEYYKNLKVGTKAQLDNKIFWPKFVTFIDINDPGSVSTPYALKGCDKKYPECNGSHKGVFENINRMEEFFGEEVALKNIEIEITQEDITWGIQKVLPWIKEYKKKKARLNGSTSIAISTSQLADNLGTGAFSIGKEQ